VSVKKILSATLIAVLLISAFAAFGDTTVTINEQLLPLSNAPAVSSMTLPVASGTDVRKNAKAEIDVSNMKDGYVMIKYLGGNNANLRVLITGPSKVQYTYHLKSDATFEVFPLSDGNGAYNIGVYRNVSGNQFSTEFTTSISVTLKDAFAPFILPNQYVNYNANTLAVKKAAELVAPGDATLKKVEKIYNHVVNNFTYDKELAATVKSGYVPNLDRVWNARKGICFDYASVTAAMLRSQNIPTKLVVGYAGTVYHAWISVWTPETGWVEGVIFFDGKDWKLMDPTYASSSNSSDSVMQFIGDGKNYATRFLY